MPVAAIQAYADQLPRLQAEEQLLAIDIGLAGASGRFDAQELAKIRRDLQRTAQGPRRKRAKKASATDLAAIGIGTRGVPPPQD